MSIRSINVFLELYDYNYILLALPVSYFKNIPRQRKGSNLIIYNRKNLRSFL